MTFVVYGIPSAIHLNTSDINQEIKMQIMKAEEDSGKMVTTVAEFLNLRDPT